MSCKGLSDYGIGVMMLMWLLPVWSFGNGLTQSTGQYAVKAYAAVEVTVADSSVLIANIGSLLMRRITERTGIASGREEQTTLRIQLALKPGIGAEGFEISAFATDTVLIAGNDYRGLLYGVGKFLRTSRHQDGAFTPTDWRGVSLPDKPVRGIYFATHFYNYYQTAPIEDVQRYIEDLSLWGMNTLMVWFDMHHFDGLADGEAQALLQRLKRYMEKAKALGLDVGFITIGNEGYNNSPEALRAVPSGGRGGYYPSAVCPSKPGGMDYILTIVGEFMDEIKYLEPDYVCIWPYDQGGCGGSCCQPWGSNGFMKCAESLSTMAKAKVPGIKTILSTWYFDKREWDAVRADLTGKAEQKWVDIVLAEHVAGYHQVLDDMPSSYPVVAFPEISMHATFPWGGFGASPLPDRIKTLWLGTKDGLSGGFPYSEGIFEDMNKVVSLQLYWDEEADIDTVMAEYIAYEFSDRAVSPVLEVVRTLEQNHRFRYWPGKLEGVKLQLDWFPSLNVPVQPDSGATEAYQRMREIDYLLPERARASWRWRILYIRAMLDAELKRNGGRPNAACMSGFRELMRIYHVTPKTDPVVSPPIPRTIE